MSMEIKYGDFDARKEGSYEVGLGTQEADVEEWMMTLTLKQIAETLRKQYGIEIGSITLHYIAFSYHKRVK